MSVSRNLRQEKYSKLNFLFCVFWYKKEKENQILNSKYASSRPDKRQQLTIGWINKEKVNRTKKEALTYPWGIVHHLK